MPKYRTTMTSLALAVLFLNADFASSQSALDPYVADKTTISEDILANSNFPDELNAILQKFEFGFVPALLEGDEYILLLQKDDCGDRGCFQILLKKIEGVYVEPILFLTGDNGPETESHFRKLCVNGVSVVSCKGG